MGDNVYPSFPFPTATDVMQYFVLRVLWVGERHVSQHHLALEPVHVRQRVVRDVVHPAVEPLQPAARRRLERVRAQLEHALRRAQRLCITPAHHHHLHDSGVHLHGASHARAHTHRVHREGRQFTARQRAVHDHVPAHPQAAEQRQLEGETHARAKCRANFRPFVVVVEKKLILALVVEVLVALLIEPLDRTDVPDLFLHADVHLREIVLDRAAQTFHPPAVEIGDHCDGRQQQQDVSGQSGRNVHHQLRVAESNRVYA